jgi:hypothetical protein
VKDGAKADFFTREGWATRPTAMKEMARIPSWGQKVRYLLSNPAVSIDKFITASGNAKIEGSMATRGGDD